MSEELPTVKVLHSRRTDDQLIITFQWLADDWHPGVIAINRHGNILDRKLSHPLWMLNAAAERPLLRQDMTTAKLTELLRAELNERDANLLATTLQTDRLATPQPA